MTTRKKPSVRKTLPQLKQESDLYRKMQCRNFVHNKTGDSYQLLFIAFTEADNSAVAVYVSSPSPWLKFTRPIDEFLASFTEQGALDVKN